MAPGRDCGILIHVNDFGPASASPRDPTVQISQSGEPMRPQERPRTVPTDPPTVGPSILRVGLMKPVQFLMLYHTDMVGSSASFSTKPHRAGAITVTLPFCE